MDISTLLEAISKLLWPILAILLVVLLYPSLRKVIEARGFTIKVGDMEITVQDATDQLKDQIEDLQKKVSELRASMQQQAQPILTRAPEKKAEKKPIKTILWVDDKPGNNAYEIAHLRDEGYQIVQANSTDAAIGKLSSRPDNFDAVVTDLGRYLGNQFQPAAGIDLIKSIRTIQLDMPVFVYTTPQSASLNKQEVIAAKGNGITGSPVELLEMIRQYNN